MYISQHVFDSRKKNAKKIIFQLSVRRRRKLEYQKRGYFNLFLLDEMRERERLKERDHLQPMVKIVRANSTTRLFEISRRGEKLV